MELFCSSVGYGNACALLNDPVILPADWLDSIECMADLESAYQTMHPVSDPNCT